MKKRRKINIFWKAIESKKTPCYNDGMSKAHEKAVAKYNAANYEKFSLRLRKEDAEKLRQQLQGRSINGFIVDAIREKLQRES